MQRKIVVLFGLVLCVLTTVISPAAAKPKKRFVPDLASFVGPMTTDGHTETQAASVTVEGHGYVVELEGELPSVCAGGEEGLPLTLHGQAVLKGKDFKLVRKPAPSTHLEGQSETVYVTVSGRFTAVNKIVGTARAETKVEAGDPGSQACRSSTGRFAMKVSP